MEKNNYVWGPFDAVPLFVSGFNNSFIKLNNENNFSIFFKDKKLSIVIDNETFISFSKEKYDYFLLNSNEIYSNLEKDIQTIQGFEEIVNNGLSRFDDDKFLSLFSEWVKLFNQFWDNAILPEFVNLGGKFLLFEKLNNLPDKEEIIKVLSTSEKLTFEQNQEQEFYSLLFLQNENMFNIMINNHANKYYWFNNNFCSTSILPIGFFEEKLKNISKEEAKKNLEYLSSYSENLKQKKDEIIKKYNLDDEIIQISNNLSYCDWLNNLKKKYSLLITHINSVFAHEIAIRENLDYDDLLFCSMDELLVFLKNHELPNLSQRKNSFLISNNNSKLEYFFEDVANDKFNTYP